MTERDIAITVIVLLSVLSILTTPFMMMKRGADKTPPKAMSPFKKILVWSSNIMITVLVLALGYYWWMKH